jgi:hypothetical protein
LLLLRVADGGLLADLLGLALAHGFSSARLQAMSEGCAESALADEILVRVKNSYLVNCRNIGITLLFALH